MEVPKLGRPCTDGLNSRTERTRRILGKRHLRRGMEGDRFVDRMGMGRSMIVQHGSQKAGEVDMLRGLESEVVQERPTLAMHYYCD